MELATLASGVATAWLADKAAQSVGIDLAKVARTAMDDVVGAAATVARLPANVNIGRIINTIV
ncbi:hypothetical protein RB25_11155 [Herbaspirillum rubrisubalbicans]|jgi:hypothetical protein|uniref:Uncharacterized protein n=2 Tax=Herbaspirillum rubrisubalbicans TaxID=80842 RepID=A0AAD0XH13_9BURK|nr:MULTISPECIES: hypothetical protein [Herbaspirillum]ALU89957.1 hypothetical protein Hrubri_2781 [Herbaspirillum rubrisubalbicans M1]AYR25027.1 hypothetical protein RC54_14875 [Herbaspirillum rubrisubalbicans]MCP1573099.1 hypothetical protein [Herbaspirillum rubrisubalbicans]NQE47442.1 hypothetical protein [Herbaspirillum rubrisubalbicans]QJQ01645.1 hypothetical protein C798_15790 [Herbaspirillum rubrisubalbicans Os34]